MKLTTLSGWKILFLLSLCGIISSCSDPESATYSIEEFVAHDQKKWTIGVSRTRSLSSREREDHVLIAKKIANNALLIGLSLSKLKSLFGSYLAYDAQTDNSSRCYYYAFNSDQQVLQFCIGPEDVVITAEILNT